MLTEGTTAPTFTLPGTDGGTEFEKYRLSDLVADGPAILVFYPFDFSPVCTMELCGFRDAEWLTMDESVDVIGISRDACYAHAEFIEANSLTFPLVSDVEGTVTESYEVKYDEWEGHPGVPKRAVFIVDTDRTIEYAWETDDAYENPDIDVLFDKITALESVSLDLDDA